METVGGECSWIDVVDTHRLEVTLFKVWFNFKVAQLLWVIFE